MLHVFRFSTITVQFVFLQDEDIKLFKIQMYTNSLCNMITELYNYLYPNKII